MIRQPGYCLLPPCPRLGKKLSQFLDCYKLSGKLDIDCRRSSFLKSCNPSGSYTQNLSPTGLVWDTNMADVTSCENTLMFGSSMHVQNNTLFTLMFSQEFALTHNFLKFSSKDSINIMQNHKYIKKFVHGVQYYWLSRRLFLIWG